MARMLLVSWTALALGAAGARAAERVYVLVLDEVGEKVSLEDWSRRHARALDEAGSALRFAAGYPRLSTPDELPRSAGKLRVLAGVCDKQAYRPALDLLRRHFKDAYVLPARAALPMACPCPGQDGRAAAPPPAAGSPWPGRYKALAAGYFHTCAVEKDGRAVCWGYDQLEQSSPPADARLKSVSAGMYHSCGLTDAGRAVCWGSDHGPYPGNATPNLPAPPEDAFVQLSAGEAHSCGLKADGSIKCWGNKTRIGDGPAGTGFRLVRVGWGQACAVKKDGRLLCWGGPEDVKSGGNTDDAFCKDVAVEMGVLDAREALLPRRQSYAMDPPAEAFSDLGLADEMVCGLTEQRELRCWGSMGTGDGCSIDIEQVKGRPGGEIAQVTVGLDHACALLADQRVVCWGQNKSPEGKYLYISSGGFHACGIRLDGEVHCWGSDQFGQLRPPDRAP
ncbi:MAG: hypothetical protein JXR96_12240 [Deltaproteobacteria bacterium]|nr:hypothetical protein [Deltaproteobacteria bacterium]